MLFKPDAKDKASSLAPFANINKNTPFADLARYIKRAEEDYIVPCISQELYDDLNTKFQANTLAGKDAILVGKLQSAIANYTVAISIDDMANKTSAMGNGRDTSEDFEHNTQQDNFLKKREAFNTADSEIEKALAYLEANKDDFDLWTSSTAYTEAQNLLIISATEFTQIAKILGNKRRVFVRLLSTIHDTERHVIEDMVGKDFLAELKTKRTSGTLTANEIIVIKDLQKILAYCTLAEEIPLLSCVLTTEGTIALPSFEWQSTKEQQLAETKLRQIAKDFDEKALPYITNLRHYLNKNADDFPTYKASDRYTPPPTGEVNLEYDYANSNIFPV
jgi:hypothetical protein